MHPAGLPPVPFLRPVREHKFSFCGFTMNTRILFLRMFMGVAKEHNHRTSLLKFTVVAHISSKTLTENAHVSHRT